MSVPKFGCRFFIRNLSDQTRFNPLGVQMLSKSLYQQVFPGAESQTEPSQEAINKSVSHLSEHGLWTNGSGTTVTQENIDINLPPLFGENILSHFTKLAEDQVSPYRPLIASLVCEGSLSSPPTQWNYKPGWTCYSNDGSITLVPFPDEKALIFDVEVCVPEGHAPKLAIAMSPNNVYSWVSPRLFSERDFAEKSKVNFDELIPLEGGESWSERIVVGHNVSYDRARIKEQYLFNGPKTKFLDTLSLHTCVSGQTSTQKVLWRSALKRKRQEMESKAFVQSHNEDEFFDAVAKLSRLSKEKWMEVSSPNSLADVYQLYCGGEKIDKSLSEIFIKGNSSDIRDNFQDLMGYCYQDVKCTYEILKVLYPLFLHHCPHPVTLAGMLEMSTMYLPVNESWNTFMQSASYTAEDMELEMTKKLMFVADQACSYMKNEKYQEDIWLSNLDWSSKKYTSKRKTKKEMRALMEKVRSCSINQDIATRNKMEEEQDEGERETLLINDPNIVRRGTHKPGYPEWYRKLCVNINHSPWEPGPCKITPSMRVTPYLLRIKWAGHPVYYHALQGWGYIIPKEGEERNDLSNELILSDFEAVSDDDLLTNSLFPISEDDDGPPKMKERSNKSATETRSANPDDTVMLQGKYYYYYRIPHKYGRQYKCGSPLSKDYISKMQSGILTSALGDGGRRILELNSMTSYWRSTEKRLFNQFVVWTNEESASDHKRKAQGVIIPKVQVSGTVTRRAVEPTWLTASNAKINKIGSEQKAFVQAPPGYCIVGADVDSQEVWIASLLGDNHFTGLQGGTAFGWMSLQGNKSEGTDIHSKTAQTIGITRDHAKVFNYSRIYGSGKQFASTLLKQFNPLLSDEEIDAKSNSLYESTKGIRRMLLSKKAQAIASSAGITIHSDGSINISDWVKEYKSFPPKSRVGTYWYGGTESHMFNKLESIAKSPQPRTPVLNCLISTALQKENVKEKFMTSRINWVVQSSAVDYLHLLLVAVKWLMAHYNITGGRLCISIHDEVRYIVREEDKYKMSLALQVANIWTRAMFAHQLGMNDLPLSVAFFSAIDIDTVLRKEVNMDCETPSNPLGLKKRYGIGFGEAVNIKQTIEKLRETKHLDV